jgi:poly-gamma-glutamate synthesis protein (capsule biosynthesis protein)
VSALAIPEHQFGLLSSRFNPGSALFMGDIMLGRSVEVLMDTKGTSTPFLHVQSLIESYDLSVANFEASVPREHIQTKPLTMRFSVKQGSLEYLKEIGLDVLSLANNHALDYGESGYVHTKSLCEHIGLSCPGHPTQLDYLSVVFKEIGDTTLSILMIHTLFDKPSTTTLAILLEEMSHKSDLQFAFIHWGEEYERVHNIEQAELAYLLIDGGIDAVIGHHPHVMQDIEEYRGKPIFYSLGNLIFDQYFSDDVQQGYMVAVAFKKRTVEYTIIPYSSLSERSVPRILEGEEYKQALEKLIQSSNLTYEVSKSGTFEYFW